MTLYLARLSSDKNWDDKNTFDVDDKWEAAEEFVKNQNDAYLHSIWAVDVKNIDDRNIFSFVVRATFTAFELIGRKRALKNTLTILPCPFCGSNKLKTMFDCPLYSVRCDSCLATGETDEQERGAIGHWNTRAELNILRTIGYDEFI